MRKILYALSKTGALLTWSIEQSKPNEILYVWGIEGCKLQSQTETIETNQSGRSLQDQVNLRMQSRLNRRYDLGYKDTIEEALACPNTNSAGLLRPMLAQKYDPATSGSARKKIWQYKYNGHRCLVTRNGDRIIAYTRNGKLINTIDHILEGMDIPEHVILDGELYVHGMSLQTISSLARRKQPDSEKLTYVVYDQMSSDNFMDRFDELHTFKLGENTIIAPTNFDIGVHIVSNKFITDNAIAKGYEGFMLRDPEDGGYKPGKRVNSLLKAKTRMDHEFAVVNIHESKDGWGILELLNHIGHSTFRTPAPGTMEEKRDVLVNKHLYIGRMVRVEYPELTDAGIPFHPVAMEWADEVIL